MKGSIIICVVHIDLITNANFDQNVFKPFTCSNFTEFFHYIKPSANNISKNTKFFTQITIAIAMSLPSSSAVRALAMEYKSLQEEPVEGFRVKLCAEENIFEWEVAIFGPPDTLYQGGYFKVSVMIEILLLSLTMLV